MTNEGQKTSEELQLQGLVDRYLQFRQVNSSHNGFENHLDEDSLTAFVESRTNERETSLIIKHLIDCSFCLNVTGELVKLNAALTEDEFTAVAATREPTKVADVLSGLLSRIFGASDGAVFAHQEPDKEESNHQESKESSSN